MKPYSQMTKAELETEQEHVLSLLTDARELHLKLDMSRGKPCKEQLDLSMEMLTDLASAKDCLAGETDVRNYGVLGGLPEARAYFAELLGTTPDCVFVGGNASLQLMYDLISKAVTHGLKNSPTPWKNRKTLRFLCPAPGYDRHFRITESFGFDMIPIAMTDHGPDMDSVEQWVKDPDVVGMWCCPKFSNPDGIVYDDETVRRIAALQTAAPDFALIWDNAYVIHEFDTEYREFPDILSLADAAGNRDMVYEFASTSKITFPGAGISCMASSPENIAYLTKLIGVQTIGFDKINQLRHVRFLQSKQHTLELMQKHAAILKPHFDVVLDALETEIAPLEIARWTKPKGGYFISLYAMPGTAKKTLSLCKEAGVTMTPAGATYPKGQDPFDSNIRIAPSVPSVEELREASRILCLCLRLTALDQLLKLT